jgi:hypothetical protein
MTQAASRFASRVCAGIHLDFGALQLSMRIPPRSVQALTLAVSRIGTPHAHVLPVVTSLIFQQSFGLHREPPQIDSSRHTRASDSLPLLLHYLPIKYLYEGTVELHESHATVLHPKQSTETIA